METSPGNFDSLQRLLRLKRHEQPHPRYFNDFSSRVLARIEAGEARVVSHWWERFGIDLRPVLTLGVGAAACAALFFSVAATPERGQPARGVGGPSLANVGGAASGQDSFVQPETLNMAVNMAAANSTNPVVNAAGTMMLDPWRTRVMPASFSPR